MSVGVPHTIPFAPATAVNTVLGVAMVYGRPKVGVQLAPSRTRLADQTLGTFTITIQGTNNPRAAVVTGEGRSVADSGEHWIDLGTISETDAGDIVYVDGPVYAIRAVVTAISGYTAGDMVLWVL